MSYGSRTFAVRQLGGLDETLGSLDSLFECVEFGWKEERRIEKNLGSRSLSNSDDKTTGTFTWETYPDLY